MTAANNVTLTSSLQISSNTTTVSTAQCLSNKATGLIITSQVSNRTDGTYTTTVEHSPDGTNWFTLGSTAAQSANGMVILRITDACFQNLRASILSSAVTTGAKVSVRVWYSLRD